MLTRKITFNIYEDPDEGKVIPNSLIAAVAKETPFDGVIVWHLADGRDFCADRRRNVKSEIYDVWIQKRL